MNADNREIDIAVSGLDSAEMQGKYLTFYMESQLYGMPIAEVVQIIGMRDITEIPEYPAYAKGIIQLRGGVIPVVDLRLRFGKAERAYDEKTCIIVAAISGTTVGLIVDEVDAVVSIAEELIAQPPKLSSYSTENDFLTGIAQMEGKTVLVLCCTNILSVNL